MSAAKPVAQTRAEAAEQMATAAERLLEFRPGRNLADNLRDSAARMAALRHAVAAYRGIVEPLPLRAQVRSIFAERIAAEPPADSNPAFFRDAVAKVDAARMRRIAETLAAEHEQTVAASARLAAQIRRLEEEEPDESD